VDLRSGIEAGSESNHHRSHIDAGAGITFSHNGVDDGVWSQGLKGCRIRVDEDGHLPTPQNGLNVVGRGGQTTPGLFHRSAAVVNRFCESNRAAYGYRMW
jgi:hypothetical protein